jgi:hypothetical protein
MAQDQLDSHLELLQQQLLGFVSLFQNTIEGVRAELRAAGPQPALQQLQHQQQQASNPFDSLQAGIFQPRSLTDAWTSIGQLDGSRGAALLLQGSSAPLQQQGMSCQHAAPAGGLGQQQQSLAVAEHVTASKLTKPPPAAATACDEVLLETQLEDADGADTSLLPTQLLDDGLAVDQPAATAAASAAELAEHTPSNHVAAKSTAAGMAPEQQQEPWQQLQHSSLLSANKQRQHHPEQDLQQHTHEEQLQQQQERSGTQVDSELNATDSSDSRRMQPSPAAASSSSDADSVATGSTSIPSMETEPSMHGNVAAEGDSEAAAAAGGAAGDAGEVVVELAGDDDTHISMLRVTYPGGRSTCLGNGHQLLADGVLAKASSCTSWQHCSLEREPCVCCCLLPSCMFGCVRQSCSSHCT